MAEPSLDNYTKPPILRIPHNFGFLLREVTPYRRTLLLALALMLAESGVSLVVPRLAGQFSGALLAGKDINRILLGWLCLVAAQSVLNFGNRYVLGRTGAQMLAQLSARLYDRLQLLPLSWHQHRRRGEVLALLTNDVARIGYFVTGTAIPMLPQIVTLCGALLMMFRIAPHLAVLGALLLPLFFVALKILGRRMRPLSSRAMQEYAAQVAMAEQNLGMLPIIKSFTREAGEAQRYLRQTQQVLDLDTRQLRMQALLAPGIRFMAAAGIVLLLWLSGREVANGLLSPPDLVSLLLYGMLLAQPLSNLADVYGQIQTARGAAERLLETFNADPEPVAAGLPDLPPPVRGAIRFENVGFHYPDRPPLLHRFDLEIRAGETLALTGNNGAGKSTLAHLLMRFSDPQSGRILVDGRDIREVTLHSLRAQIGWVAQNVLLFNGSVADNLRYGRFEATAADMVKAAQAARAHEFVMRLPQGYDTPIGDDGVRLSGGQKQRIALARALLKNPAVLILDEATAMFDPQGERDFIAECRDFLKTRTVILITHRPATLALADRVLRMEHGQLVTVR